MGKIIKISCDGCGAEPNPRQNFLMISGQVTQFDDKGELKASIPEWYFCNECSSKILQTIENCRAIPK